MVVRHAHYRIPQATAQLTMTDFDILDSISGLYLDTEVRDDIVSIAAQADEYGLQPAALHDLWMDVEAVVWINLCLPAGEWAGFDSEWLHAEVGRARERSWLRRCGSLLVRHGIGVTLRRERAAVARIRELVDEFGAADREAVYKWLRGIAYPYFWAQHDDTDRLDAVDPGFPAAIPTARREATLARVGAIFAPLIHEKELPTAAERLRRIGAALARQPAD